MTNRSRNRILIALGIIGGAFIAVIIGLLIVLFMINGTEEFSRAQVSGAPSSASGQHAFFTAVA
jgi:hypothetical protein